MTTSLKAMTDQARSLKNQGGVGAAIEQYVKAAAAYPGSAVAEHNLAAVLGEAGARVAGPFSILHVARNRSFQRRRVATHHSVRYCSRLIGRLEPRRIYLE